MGTWKKAYKTQNTNQSKKNFKMSSSNSNTKNVRNVRNANNANSCDVATGVSLCIPRVFNNIGWRRIKQTFISCGWGYVERVDVIHCGTHKRAFVHFAPGKWNTRSGEAMAVLDALRGGQQVQVIYDEPWFWKVSASGSKKPTDAPKPRLRPSVVIGASDEEKSQVEESHVDMTPMEKGEIREEVAAAMRRLSPIDSPTTTTSSMPTDCLH